MDPKQRYQEQLQDPRWTKRREEIIERDRGTCKICKRTDVELNVHHRRYAHGRDVWDYPDHELETLCSECHRAYHKLSDAITSSSTSREKFYKDRVGDRIYRARREHSGFLLLEDPKDPARTLIIHKRTGLWQACSYDLATIYALLKADPAVGEGFWKLITQADEPLGT